LTSQRIPSQTGAYSDAVITSGDGRWIHLSGMLGLDADGALVQGSMFDEAMACFAAIEATLSQAGAELRDVIKINAYLTDLGLYDDFARARAATFAEDPPASAAVEVSGLLLGARVEIEAIAHLAA
jgi:2-iminobutanoate/2-iminopropanoate deaminase